MRDDSPSADWASGHRHLPSDLTRLFAMIGHSLERLNALQFDAPWRHDVRPIAAPGARDARRGS